MDALTLYIGVRVRVINPNPNPNPNRWMPSVYYIERDGCSNPQYRVRGWNDSVQQSIEDALSLLHREGWML
jgi:hypothetical protein